MDRADLTATDLARAVRAGDLDPVAVAEDTLARISSGNQAFGAFRRVRYQEAVAEAGALKERADLAELALAGVPIAVKDVIAVAGEYAGWGSRAGPQRPFDSDSEIVARLRGAGAVIVGLTRVPELCLWPMTDTAEAVVRTPTPGGRPGPTDAPAITRHWLARRRIRRGCWKGIVLPDNRFHLGWFLNFVVDAWNEQWGSGGTPW
jgi:Asp-tRNA(Asn)/Glu-tRNA(Gln) amidotransferase A subunit family amidase